MDKKNYRIPLFYLVTSLFWFSLYTYVPILPTYAKSLGASYVLVGLIVGSYGFTQMLLRIPLGVISDRLNKRKIFITLGIIIALVSALGLWNFTNATAVLVFRSLTGAAAATWVSFTVLFSSYFEENEAPGAIGLVNAFCSLGTMTAIFIGGAAVQRFGPKASFIIASGGAVAGIILSLFLVEKTVNRKPMKIKELISVARDANFLLVSVLAILSQFITFATVYGFTPVAARQIGATDFQLGLLTALSTLPGIFASALSGSFFARKLGERRTIIYGFLIAAVSCISIPYIGNIHLLYVTQIIGGFGWGSVFPLLMGLSIKNVGSEKRATAMGFFQAIYGLGMFAGPSIVGFLGDTVGLAWGFWATGIVGVLGACLTVFYKKQVIDNRKV